MDLPWTVPEPNLELPDEPWMPARTAARLSALLANSDTYLEYGVGGSDMRQTWC